GLAAHAACMALVREHLAGSPPGDRADRRVLASKTVNLSCPTPDHVRGRLLCRGCEERQSPPLPDGERACPGPDPGSVLAFGEDLVRGVTIFHFDRCPLTLSLSPTGRGNLCSLLTLNICPAVRWRPSCSVTTAPLELPS